MTGEKLFSDKAPKKMFDNGDITEDIKNGYNIVEERYDKYLITAINKRESD